MRLRAVLIISLEVDTKRLEEEEKFFCLYDEERVDQKWQLSFFLPFLAFLQRCIHFTRRILSQIILFFAHINFKMNSMSMIVRIISEKNDQIAAVEILKMKLKNSRTSKQKKT